MLNVLQEDDDAENDPVPQLRTLRVMYELERKSTAVRGFCKTDLWVNPGPLQPRTAGANPFRRPDPPLCALH